MNPSTIFLTAALGWLAIIAFNHPVVSAVVLILALAAARSTRATVAVAGLTLPAAVSFTLINSSQALAVSLRFSALMAVGIAAAQLIDATDLAKWLHTSPLGHRGAYIATTSLRLVPLVAETIREVRWAARLEGMRRTPIVPVVVRLLDEGTQRAATLTAVGFDEPGPRTVLIPLRDNPVEKAYRRYAVPAIAVTLGVLAWAM